MSDSRISFEEARARRGGNGAADVGEQPGYVIRGSSPKKMERLRGYRVELAVQEPARLSLDRRDRHLSDADGAGARHRARSLLSALLETLERQGYVAAIGAIALPNAASVALHEKLGFTYAGTYRGVGFKMGDGSTSACGKRTWHRAMPDDPSRYVDLHRRDEEACGVPSGLADRSPSK